MEVLQLIAEGKANKETAAELGISIKTVEKHREHLMQQARHPRHRRSHPLRHQRGHHREQRPVDHHLVVSNPAWRKKTEQHSTLNWPRGQQGKQPLFGLREDRCILVARRANEFCLAGA